MAKKKSAKGGRPPKLKALPSCIRERLQEGRVRFRAHALEQMRTRKIREPEVRFVLENGSEEKRKTEFDETHRKWKYAVRGWTLDREKELRVVVNVDESTDMIIVTAIDLGLGE